MGYCGIKIAGHSETDFKHRKAFVTRKKVLDIETSYDNVANTSRTYNYDSKSAIKIRIVSLILISLFLVVTYFAGKNLYKAGIDPHLSALQSPKKNVSSEASHAALLMYDSAKTYYNSGSLNQAQEEMIRVLKLYPTNKEALILMSKILDKQCVTKRQFCKDAQQYKEYLNLTLEI